MYKSPLYARKEEIQLTKPCSRFNPFYQNVNKNSALVYLQLRREGCEMKEALKFTKKNYCRTDITKVIDGPASFRKLKVKNDVKSLNRNVNFLSFLKIQSDRDGKLNLHIMILALIIICHQMTFSLKTNKLHTLMNILTSKKRR